MAKKNEGSTETIGVRLARLREAKGLNQVALAKAIGMTQQRVAQLEHPDSDDMRTSVARRIAKVLGCSSCDITEG